MNKRIVIFLTVVCCVLFSGCGKETSEQSMSVYYLSAENNVLLQESYPSLSVEEALDKMKVHGVLNDTVEIEKYNLYNTNLNLYFTEK